MNLRRLGRFYVTGIQEQQKPEWLSNFRKGFEQLEANTLWKDERRFNLTEYVGTHPKFEEVDTDRPELAIPAYLIDEFEGEPSAYTDDPYATCIRVSIVS